MIWRGADDRQPQGDVHAAPEVQHLHRDQRLVVIHADHGVVGAAGGLVKQSVGGFRTGAVDTQSA